MRYPFQKPGKRTDQVEIFFKDEAFVFNRRFVGNNDISVTIYTRKLGIENVYIQGGQIIKNLPYTYLDRFSHLKGVFVKLKEEKIAIHEIDSVNTFGIYVSKEIETFEMLTDVSSLIYTYAPYPDHKIYNLYKKVLFYSIDSISPFKYYIAFLVKLNYLLGVYNPSIVENQELLNRLLNTKLADITKVAVDKTIAVSLASALKQNLKRWLE